MPQRKHETFTKLSSWWSCASGSATSRRVLNHLDVDSHNPRRMRCIVGKVLSYQLKSGMGSMVVGQSLNLRKCNALVISVLWLRVQLGPTSHTCSSTDLGLPQWGAWQTKTLIESAIEYGFHGLLHHTIVTIDAYSSLFIYGFLLVLYDFICLSSVFDTLLVSHCSPRSSETPRDGSTANCQAHRTWRKLLPGNHHCQNSFK